MDSRSEFIRSLPYFTVLSNAEVGRIEKDILERTFDKGELLFLEGQPCRGLYVVKSGQVRVFKSSAEGKEQVLLVAKPGQSFNDVPVFDGSSNPASASALEPSTVYIIPKETILSLLSGCPAAAAILKIFATRLRHLTSLVEDLSFRTVVSRLSKMLLDLAVAEGGEAAVPRLTQDEMAARLGTVRDVIGRGLRALEKEGAIRIQAGRIVVTDRRKLKDLS